MPPRWPWLIRKPNAKGCKCQDYVSSNTRLTSPFFVAVFRIKYAAAISGGIWLGLMDALFRRNASVAGHGSANDPNLDEISLRQKFEVRGMVHGTHLILELKLYVAKDVVISNTWRWALLKECPDKLFAYGQMMMMVVLGKRLDGTQDPTRDIRAIEGKSLPS